MIMLTKYRIRHMTDVFIIQIDLHHNIDELSKTVIMWFCIKLIPIWQLNLYQQGSRQLNPTVKAIDIREEQMLRCCLS